jgi:phosphopantetheinyl transferase
MLRFYVYFHPQLANKSMPFAFALSFEPAGELVVWKVEETPAWFKDQLSLSKRLWQDFHEITAQNVRVQWLASRFALQQVAKVPEMDLHKDHFGKPHLANDHRFMSLSHCQGYAAAIAAEGPVGIDVEMVNPRVQRIKDRFLSESEQSLLGPTDEALMLAWSAKESVYKMHGEKKLLFKEQMIIEGHDTAAQCLHLRLILPATHQWLRIRYHFINDCVLSWVVLD